MPIRGDLTQLKAEIDYYRDKGYGQQCEWAARYAQRATREYIERMHPATGFGGRDILHAQINTGTDNLIQKGAFKITGTAVDASIYANYWARWYNTGVYLRDSRRYQPPRGTIFASNVQAIESFFVEKLQEYLQKIIKIRS